MRLLSRRKMILIAVFSLFNNFAISVILMVEIQMRLNFTPPQIFICQSTLCFVGSLMNTHIRHALGTIINHSIINAVNLNTIFVLGRNVAIRANSTAQYFPLFLCQSYIHNRQSRGYSPGCKYAIAFNSFWRSVAQLTLRAIHSSAGFSAIHSFR